MYVNSDILYTSIITVYYYIPKIQKYVIGSILYPVGDRDTDIGTTESPVKDRNAEFGESESSNLTFQTRNLGKPSGIQMNGSE